MKPARWPDEIVPPEPGTIGYALSYPLFLAGLFVLVSALFLVTAAAVLIEARR